MNVWTERQTERQTDRQTAQTSRLCGARSGSPQLLHHHWSTVAAGILSLYKPVCPTLYHNLIRNHLYLTYVDKAW